jgi:hypothetical protein
MSTTTTPTRREQIVAAEVARDEGMAAALNAADPRIVLAIDEAIAKANASGKAWSANDIRDQFPTCRNGLVGERVNAAANRRPREMTSIGRTPSTLKSTHAHEIKVWIGIQTDDEEPTS